MSFLYALELDEALRKPYHQGDANAAVELLLDELHIGKHRSHVKQNFDTACWMPPVPGRESHSFYYGDKMLTRVYEFFKAKHKREPTFAELVKAVHAYARHERWHALETPQNLELVHAELKKVKLQFPLFNLFEDARIEAKARKVQGTRFDWVDFEELAPIGGSVWNLFLRCIQLEESVDTEAQAHEEHGERAKRVFGYYQRACRCATAWDLIPLMREFMDEFEETPPPDEGDGGGGDGEGDASSSSGAGSGSGAGKPGSGAPDSGDADGKGKGSKGEDDDGEGSDGDDDKSNTGAGIRSGDLETALEAREKGKDFFAEFDEDAEIYGGDDDEAKAKLKALLKPEPTKCDTPGQGIEGSVTPIASGGPGSESDFLHTHEFRVDQKRVDRLVGVLMRMFKTHSLSAYTEQDGHRLSVRHLARGELRFVHKKVYGGKGKRKYSVVFDCSGSMSTIGGLPAAEGRIFLLALNVLARRGLLEGYLILSGYAEKRTPRGREVGPAWLKYKFPVADNIIKRINPECGAEGLQPAMADNLKDLTGMDDVFVYTDSCITDAPIDRDMFARKKIWPVGLYVGPESNAKSMDKHFPQNIIKDNIEQVVETMLIRNKRTMS